MIFLRIIILSYRSSNLRISDIHDWEIFCRFCFKCISIWPCSVKIILILIWCVFCKSGYCNFIRNQCNNIIIFRYGFLIGQILLSLYFLNHPALWIHQFNLWYFFCHTIPCKIHLCSIFTRCQCNLLIVIADCFPLFLPCSPFGAICINIRISRLFCCFTSIFYITGIFYCCTCRLTAWSIVPCGSHWTSRIGFYRTHSNSCNHWCCKYCWYQFSCFSHLFFSSNYALL